MEMNVWKVEDRKEVLRSDREEKERKEKRKRGNAGIYVQPGDAAEARRGFPMALPLTHFGWTLETGPGEGRGQLTSAPFT